LLGELFSFFLRAIPVFGEQEKEKKSRKWDSTKTLSSLTSPLFRLLARVECYESEEERQRGINIQSKCNGKMLDNKVAFEVPLPIGER
jgi:hypothetical protein